MAEAGIEGHVDCRSLKAQREEALAAEREHRTAGQVHKAAAFARRAEALDRQPQWTQGASPANAYVAMLDRVIRWTQAFFRETARRMRRSAIRQVREIGGDTLVAVVLSVEHALGLGHAHAL